MKNLYVVHCWDDFGDGESGPMVEDWYEYVEAESVGDAWLSASGSVCRTNEQDEDGKYFPDIRLATKEERKEYKRYREMEKEYLEKFGCVPFGPEDVLPGLA